MLRIIEALYLFDVERLGNGDRQFSCIGRDCGGIALSFLKVKEAVKFAHVASFTSSRIKDSFRYRTNIVMDPTDLNNVAFQREVALRCALVRMVTIDADDTELASYKVRKTANFVTVVCNNIFGL